MSRRRRERRRNHAARLRFLESVRLRVEGGAALRQAWEAAGSETSTEPVPGPREGEPMTAFLERLGASGEWEPIAPLAELYRSGTAMAPLLRQATRSMRERRLRELETHARELPRRLGVVAILFFLPPALALLLLPVLLEFLR